MAKFLKSFFNPGERKRNSKGEPRGADDEDRNDFTPPLDGRRKLSISRSGRMKQNNKRRASLNKELFGDKDLQIQDKPSSKEYHVHGKAFSETRHIQSVASSSKPEVIEHVVRVKQKVLDVNTNIESPADEVMTPEEEEIEKAFRVLETNDL